MSSWLKLDEFQDQELSVPDPLWHALILPRQ